MSSNISHSCVNISRDVNANTILFTVTDSRGNVVVTAYREYDKTALIHLAELDVIPDQIGAIESLQATQVLFAWALEQGYNRFIDSRTPTLSAHLSLEGDLYVVRGESDAECMGVPVTLDETMLAKCKDLLADMTAIRDALQPA